MQSPTTQIKANCRHTQLSAGPRTREGKAAAGHNVITHGLTTGRTVPPGENLQDFQAVMAALQREARGRRTADPRPPPSPTSLSKPSSYDTRLIRAGCKALQPLRAIQSLRASRRPTAPKPEIRKKKK